MIICVLLSGADPGFPIGGAPSLVGGGTNLQHRRFSVKTYVKTKEFGPVGGGTCRKLLYVDPPLVIANGSPIDKLMLAQSAARLTLVQEVASSSPTAGRLTQPSIPPWVGKMSTWWMMAIGGICAFQIGLHNEIDV